MGFLLFVALFIGACSAKLKINGLVLLPYQRTNETSLSMLQDAFSIIGPGGWISLVVQFTQPTINSTTIVNADNLDLVSSTIAAAKRLGFSVIVKPHVDLSDDALHWRGLPLYDFVPFFAYHLLVGEIGKFFNDSQWNAWFSSYQDMIKSVAAAGKEADALNLGTELTLTQVRERNWRDVIATARGIFPGTLTYGANHNDEASVQFWDALDWIGNNLVVGFLGFGVFMFVGKRCRCILPTWKRLVRSRAGRELEFRFLKDFESARGKVQETDCVHRGRISVCHR